MQSIIKYIVFGIILAVLVFVYAMFYYGLFPYDQLDSAAAINSPGNQFDLEKVAEYSARDVLFLLRWYIVPMLILIFCSWRYRLKRTLLITSITWFVLGLLPALIWSTRLVGSENFSEDLGYFIMYLSIVVPGSVLAIGVLFLAMYGFVVSARIKYRYIKFLPLIILMLLLVGLPVYRYIVLANANSCGDKYANLRMWQDGNVIAKCNAAHAVDEGENDDCLHNGYLGVQHQSCIKLKARVEKSVESCIELEPYGVVDQIDCYVNVIEETQNMSLCDDWEDQHTRGYCYDKARDRLNVL